MTARETILAAIRQNRPEGDYPLPDLPDFPSDDSDLTVRFLKNLEAMGGRASDRTDLAALLHERFADAKVIASTVPEYAGNRDLAACSHPRELADVDVAIVRAAFGVAETGSVLLTDAALQVNALGYLAQHLIVLLDPAEILPTLQQAYRRGEIAGHPYTVLHTGPSATADIEGVLIHGAQGVRSLTVVLKGA